MPTLHEFLGYSGLDRLLGFAHLMDLGAAEIGAVRDERGGTGSPHKTLEEAAEADPSIRARMSKDELAALAEGRAVRRKLEADMSWMEHVTDSVALPLRSLVPPQLSRTCRNGVLADALQDAASALSELCGGGTACAGTAATADSVAAQLKSGDVRAAFEAGCDKMYAALMNEFVSGPTGTTAPAADVDADADADADADVVPPGHTCNMEQGPGAMQACFLADASALACLEHEADTCTCMRNVPSIRHCVGKCFADVRKAMCPQQQQGQDGGAVDLSTIYPHATFAGTGWLDQQLCVRSANAARVLVSGADGFLHYSTMNRPTARIIRGDASVPLRVPGWLALPLRAQLHDDENPAGMFTPRQLLESLPASAESAAGGGDLHGQGTRHDLVHRLVQFLLDAGVVQ